jgi:hypothetical protein
MICRNKLPLVYFIGMTNNIRRELVIPQPENVCRIEESS